MPSSGRSTNLGSPRNRKNPQKLLQNLREGRVWGEDLAEGWDFRRMTSGSTGGL